MHYIKMFNTLKKYTVVKGLYVKKENLPYSILTA